MSDILKVDVWSDIACPWCYVGKRRFEEGVRRYHERGGNRTVPLPGALSWPGGARSGLCRPAPPR
jgi:DSBA-like thioredoxin domain